MTKKYTVILLYPDYMSENYGQETYMTCVDAKNPTEAVANARAEISAGGENEQDEEAEPTDFFVIAVIAGDHEDLNPER